MDYKDLVTVSLAALCGVGGGIVAGGLGVFLGIVVGSGLGATWAYQTDLRTATLANQAE
ncbi:MAG: hypothetical protein U5K28_06635 [Halobacteriales archaeon]|nr:hypothetical protein [Halobacteriales archaeon]